MTSIVSRLILLLVALAAATVLVVGGMSVLASLSPPDATPLLQRDQVADLQRAVEAPVEEEAAGASPTPTVVLVFAGIVLMATLPPVHRVHVYHGSYHRYD